MEEQTLEQLRKQTEATKRKIAKAMTGDGNSQWKDGRRSYRNKAGAKTNDKSIIHHKDGNRHNNAKSNLEKVPESKRGAHDAAHNRGANFKKSGGTKKGAHSKRSHPKRMK